MHTHQASLHAWPALPLLALLAACTQAPPSEPTPPPRQPQQAGQPLDPLKTAGHITAARVAALTGDQEGIRRNMQGDRAALEAIPEM